MARKLHLSLELGHDIFFKNGLTQDTNLRFTSTKQKERSLAQDMEARDLVWIW